MGISYTSLAGGECGYVGDFVCGLILRFGDAAYVAETVHVVVCIQVYLFLLAVCVGVRACCIAGLRFDVLVDWGFTEVTVYAVRGDVRRVGECILIGAGVETGVVADGSGIVGCHLYLLAAG